MRSPLSRTIRRGVLAATLFFLACGKDDATYQPLGSDATPRATVVAGLVREANQGVVSDAVVVMEPASNGVAASAQWLAKNPGAQSVSTPGRRVTTTNARGRFYFDDVATGDYFVQVIADDHLGAMHSIHVPDRTTFVDTVYADVDLTPTGTFSGVATLENATAHQGTVVYVQGTSYVAVTDPTGAYAITDVPVGSYTIRAEHAHYLEDTENGTLTTAGEEVALASMLLKLDSNMTPTVALSVGAQLWSTVPIPLSASANDPDGSVVRWDWDFEYTDDTWDFTSVVGSTTHVYAAGPHTAKVRVTDNDGAIAMAIISFTVIDLPTNRVYMATATHGGNNLNDGGPLTPVATLARAYQVAQADGKNEILIESGSYTGAPAFLAGINILGGRDYVTWDETTTPSTFTYNATRATANNITTLTTIRRVNFNMTLPAGGTNSIALYSLGSNNSLQFELCQFTTANGLGGATGVPGSNGASAFAGNNGAAGSCDGARGLGGSGGASPVGCTGGVGGAGGNEGINAGQNGGTGGCTGGAGGIGGSGFDGGIFCSAGAGGDGGNGVNGAAGVPGANGSAASGSGSVIANEWVPNTSNTGASGGNGRGGGGGGGGGGQGGTGCDDGGGNGAGGGGGGGAGGQGGSGGVGGRASFAVMLVNSSPRFDSCTFTSGMGGRGGNGAAGGSGGAGGGGGFGAAACLAEVGRGGDGGDGGNGGAGGGGAGGPGGPSYGVYRALGSAPLFVGGTFNIGGGGTGGNGGGTASDGPFGPSGNIF